MSFTNTDFRSSDDIKDHLSALTGEELQALEDTYQYHWQISWLRSTGQINIVLGGITLALGLFTPWGFTFPKLAQTIIGAILIGQSVWAIALPNTGDFLRYAILLLVISLWNIGVSVSFGILTLGSSFVGLLGLAQLRWAFQTFKLYRRFREMGLSKPQDDILQFYDNLWRALTKGVLKNDNDTIQLWTNRAKAKWYGLLLKDKIILALKGQNAVVIQPKADQNFVLNSPNPLKKRRVHGRIKLNGSFEQAMMKPSSFKNYVSWKKPAEIPVNVTPSLWQRLPRPIRIILLIIGGSILLWASFIIIGAIELLIRYN